MRSAATASSSRVAWRRPNTRWGSAALLSAVLLFRDALYGALVIAVACSVLGVYVVLRRIVFVGAALAQISSAGIALALFLSGIGVVGGLAGHPTAFALVFGLAGAMFF